MTVTLSRPALGSWLQRHQARLLAGTLVLGFYALARVPALPEADQARLASRFHFVEQPLPEVDGPPHRFGRDVHPQLERISGWISSEGAAVALADLDGDGLANDVCHVDPRTDQVIVAPAPGTGNRFQPFALDYGRLPYKRGPMAPMGCLVADLSEDGRQDLMVTFIGRPPILLTGTAGPTAGAAGYRPQELVTGSPVWNTIAATVADFDGDGHLDLYIGNYFADGLPILDAKSRVFDPGSGWMHQSFSRGGVNGGSQKLFLWQGVGPEGVRFAEAQGVLDSAGAGHGWSLAAAATDLNGDLLPELYIANDFGPDHLLRNDSEPGRLRFTRLTGQKGLTVPNSKVLGNDSFKGMGAEPTDLNGDGRLDLLVSNITVDYGLQESNFAFIHSGDTGAMARGIAPFSDRSEAMGLSRTGGWNWEVRTGDFDNDTTPEVLFAVGFLRGGVNRWPELQELAHVNDTLIADPRFWPTLRQGDALSDDRPNPFFVRGEDGRYHDLARPLGLGRPRVSRGIATADVDGDGRLDYAVAEQWASSYFYRNRAPNPGAFLGLHVLLPTGDAAATRVRSGHPGSDTPGRPAIGAEAVVTLPDGRRLVAQIDGGNGHSGRRSSELHFGLGRLPAGVQLPVELRWRDTAGRVHSEKLTLSPGWHTVLTASRES